MLCDGIILDAEVFERLFLYYNVGVRGRFMQTPVSLLSLGSDYSHRDSGYFLRLLVYRLSRLGSRDDGKPTLRDPRIFATLRLFESRLEKIRKRHECVALGASLTKESALISLFLTNSELDPLDGDWDSDDSFEDNFRPRAKRSTICSTWGVHDQPWAIDPYSSSRKPSMEGGEEDRADLLGLSSRSRDQHMEAIEEVPPVPALPEHIPPSTLLKNPSANSSDASLVVHSPATSTGKNTKLSTAKKVAGGWWQNLKNRKGSGNGQPNSITSPAENEPRPASHEQISPFNENAASPPSNDKSAPASEAAQPTSPPTPPSGEAKYTTGRDSKPVARPFSRGSEANAIPPQLPDLLKVETAGDRLKKQSSRKSLRRAPSSASRRTAGASSAASPRSRRSSMYSFDLEVDTPRSDSFDFPISPSSANGGALSPTTAAGSSAAGLGLSPLAFSALLDGNLNFAGSRSGEGSTTPLSPNRPRHQRGKSASSVRKSRPVSVASNRSGGNGPSPRVSKRFSKRASILPPPALDLLKESPSEPVPKIPEQYKTPTTANTQNGLLSAVFPNPAMSGDKADRPPSPPPYEQKKHAYAIRGLREYEDCLDEWELFVHRAKEEEGADGREVSCLRSSRITTRLTLLLNDAFPVSAQRAHPSSAVCLAVNVGGMSTPHIQHCIPQQHPLCHIRLVHTAAFHARASVVTTTLRRSYSVTACIPVYGSTVGAATMSLLRTKIAALEVLGLEVDLPAKHSSEVSRNKGAVSEVADITHHSFRLSHSADVRSARSSIGASIGVRMSSSNEFLAFWDDKRWISVSTC